MTKNKKQETTNTAAAGQSTHRCESILEALQEVLQASKNSHFCQTAYRKEKLAKEAFDYLNTRLGLSDKQCVLLAVIVEEGLDNWATADDIVRHVGCNRIELMQLNPELTDLSMKGLIEYDGKTRFAFPVDAFKAFCNNEVYNNRVQRFEGNDDLYTELFIIHSKTGDNEMIVNTLHSTTDRLLECNAELPFAKTMLRYKNVLTDEEYRFLIITAISWLVMHIANNIYDVSFVFGSQKEGKKLAKNLRNNNSMLTTMGILEKVEEGGLDGENYTLTNRTKKSVNPEWTESSKSMNKNLYPVAKIAPKALFYNKETSRQIAELGTLLDEENLQGVLGRLKERNFRCAFTCLFHGGPGTGKTETVYQLARVTGRDIYQVDYSELHSKWIGESEKNVKAMFDEYRALCKGCTPAPILLLNEADALIGKRTKVEHSSDKGENAVQNIILQEMESMEGILIATTNLTDNMDKAFERRFLYKIRFEEPDTEVRAKIWRSMLPSLNKKDASILSDRFPKFAGGQIENVTRKVTVGEVLHGRKTKIGDIITLCEREMLEGASRQKSNIGFVLRK